MMNSGLMLEGSFSKNSSEFGEKHILLQTPTPTRWRDGNFRSQILSDDDTTNTSSVFLHMMSPFLLSPFDETFPQ